mmetsp:Transcript_4085/g.7804  ORF Transcript_4085/g.7804 Transcript_4085/m.7804 type:complete len:144 (+) Transcript_4085:44-475(+)
MMLTWWVVAAAAVMGSSPAPLSLHPSCSCGRATGELIRLRGGKETHRRKAYIGRRGTGKQVKRKLEQLSERDEVYGKKSNLPRNILEKRRKSLMNTPKEAPRRPKPDFLLSRKRNKDRKKKSKGYRRLSRYRKRHRKRKKPQN